MIAVADTSFIIAFLNRREANHLAAAQVYSSVERILLPQTSLAEIAYLIQLRLGSAAAAAFLDRLEQDKITIASIDAADLRLTSTILREYADSRIDFVDATIMAIAVRLEVETILTLDRRDFSIYKPAHCDYFTLLP